MIKATYKLIARSFCFRGGFALWQLALYWDKPWRAPVRGKVVHGVKITHLMWTNKKWAIWGNRAKTTTRAFVKKEIHQTTHPPSNKQPNNKTEALQLAMYILCTSRDELFWVSRMMLHRLCSDSQVCQLQKESCHFTCHQKLEIQKRCLMPQECPRFSRFKIFSPKTFLCFVTVDICCS